MNREKIRKAVNFCVDPAVVSGLWYVAFGSMLVGISGSWQWVMILAGILLVVLGLFVPVRKRVLRGKTK